MKIINDLSLIFTFGLICACTSESNWTIVNATISNSSTTISNTAEVSQIAEVTQTLHVTETPEVTQNLTEKVRDILKAKNFALDDGTDKDNDESLLYVLSMVNRRKHLMRSYRMLEGWTNCSYSYQDVALRVFDDTQCAGITFLRKSDMDKEELDNDFDLEKSILIALDEFSNQTSKFLYPCTPRNITENTTAIVRMVNTTECLKILSTEPDWDVGGATKHHCAMVLFYSASCTFSAKMAPHYNALGRAFPGVDILAVDVLQSNGLYARYGIVAVPNILLFHRGKPVLRFNYTERTFDNFKSFLQNNTGLTANRSVSVSLEDYEGPLSSNPTVHPDYTLWFSNSFILLFLIYIINQNLVKTS